MRECVVKVIWQRHGSHGFEFRRGGRPERFHFYEIMSTLLPPLLLFLLFACLASAQHVYIHIGAHDGSDIDAPASFGAVLRAAQPAPDLILFVEPHGPSLAALHAAYRHVAHTHFLHAAIHATLDARVVLYAPANGTAANLTLLPPNEWFSAEQTPSSTTAAALAAGTGTGMTEYAEDGMRLATVLAHFGIATIRHLRISTGEYDAAIVQSLDLAGLRVERIEFAASARDAADFSRIADISRLHRAGDNTSAGSVADAASLHAEAMHGAQWVGAAGTRAAVAKLTAAGFVFDDSDIDRVIARSGRLSASLTTPPPSFGGDPVLAASVSATGQTADAASTTSTSPTASTTSATAPSRLPALLRAGTHAFRGIFYRLASNWFRHIPVAAFSTRAINYLEIGAFYCANLVSVAASYGLHADSVLHAIDPWIDYGMCVGLVNTKQQTKPRYLQPPWHYFRLCFTAICLRPNH